MHFYYMLGQEGKALSHPLLAAACQQEWGLSPLPPISKGQWGKPYFEGESRHFNLSHSGGVAICCLADRPVGADIQLPRPSRPAFLDKVCGEEERRWLISFHDSGEAFALLWAMKESYAKYTGRGITRPLSGLTVPLPASLPPDWSWVCYPLGDLVFSLCRLQNGLVAVCSDEAMADPIIHLT